MFGKIFIIYLLSWSAFATCIDAVPTDYTNFCASFKSVAICHCTSSGLPSGICQDMNFLYRRMVGLYGSLEKACSHQRHTSYQNCLDNWNCYLLGGVDSKKRICSSNRRACV